jgi:ribosomal protein L29
MTKFKHTRNTLKEKCKHSGIGELQEMLLEKEKEHMKLLKQVTVGAHRTAYSRGYKGNIAELRKQIAIIKTFLNIKLNHPEQMPKPETKKPSIFKSFMRR